MILPDLNLLFYAYNPHVPQHPAARRWWREAMNGEELIGLPLEHRARLFTNDGDFARFPGLEWENPLLASGTA